MVVRCDEQECTRWVEFAGAGESWWARLRAEQVGWTHADEADFCPEHSRWGEGSESDDDG